MRQLLPHAAALLKRLALLPRCLFLTASELEISTPKSVAAMRGLYLGEGLSLHYYRKLYGSPARPELRSPIWRLPDAVRSAFRSYDVVLVEINSLLVGLLPEGCFLTAPWVRQVTGLHRERYLRRMRGIERGWGQKVRRQKYEYRFAKDRASLRRFYEDYYVPYARSRHGEDAHLRSLAELQTALRRGFLLQVWQQERWRSGLVVDRSGRTFQLIAAGADSLSALHDGALSALYFFLFRWARQSGIEYVDFCGSRPHLLDGVFRHKALWGAEPIADPWHHTRIAFYIRPNAGLPETIASQLVTVDGVFIPLKQALPAAARPEAQTGGAAVTMPAARHCPSRDG